MNLDLFREALINRLRAKRCLHNRLVDDIRDELLYTISLELYDGLSNALLESE